MRDPKRIKPNWQKIAEIHEQFPDWRMGQFIMNMLRIITIKNDPYFLEDDELIGKIKEIVPKIQKSSKLTDK